MLFAEKKCKIICTYQIKIVLLQQIFIIIYKCKRNQPKQLAHY